MTQWAKRVTENSGGREVTIYHNPNCGTSRNVLGLIRNAGIEPTVIEYLKAPPDRQTLLGLIERKMKGEQRSAKRRKPEPKVVDLMEALRRSLDQVSAGKKKTAKVDEKQKTGPVEVPKAAARKRKAS